MALSYNESYSEVKRRVLKLDQIAIGAKVPVENLEEHIEEYSDRLSCEMAIRLNTYLYGEQHDKAITVEYKVHSTVWDRIKDEWFPEWLKKRVTINFTTHTKTYDIRFKTLYPEFVPPNRMEYVTIHEYVKQKF